MHRIHTFFCICALLSCLQLTGQDVPLYKDASRPVDERVNDLIGRMTREEKAQALNKSGRVERLGLEADGWNQGLNGVAWNQPTTQFPVPVGMAATWDTPLVQQVASVLSDEARAVYNLTRASQDPAARKGLIYRSPVVNISRNPYWGRIAECFGEDNHLTGRMGVAYVRGLQGDDPEHLKVAATLKHFAVNNVETGRTSLNAMVSERMLYEFWLPHFRDCVVEGGAMSVMASYNAVNSIPSLINRLLLTDILKNVWDFSGFVVSDYDGVKRMVEGHEKNGMKYEEAVAKAIIAGCDFSDSEFAAYIPAAVEQGLLQEKQVDAALRRVLRVRFLLGEFDEAAASPYAALGASDIRSEAHRAVSLQTARESVVLLKNADATLPLDASALKQIAVIGPLADCVLQNRYGGMLTEVVTPLQGIRTKAGSTVKVVHAPGCALPLTADEKQLTAAQGAASVTDEAAARTAAVAAAKAADVAVVFVGTSRAIEDEGHDRTSLALPEAEQALVEAVFAANPKTIVVLMSGGPLTVPWIKDNVPAVLQGWSGAELTGEAIADVLFGAYNPAGRLPYTVYASEEQVPPVDEYDVTKGFTYMYLKGAPLFAFGHGLSYTAFEYAGLSTDSETLAGEGGVLEVSLDVTNKGAVDGDEVVQLYVRAPRSYMQRPEKFLVAFQRVALKAGETRKVTLTVKGEQLAYWSVGEQGYVVQAGDYEFLAGAASDDIRLTKKIAVTEY